MRAAARPRRASDDREQEASEIASHDSTQRIGCRLAFERHQFAGDGKAGIARHIDGTSRPAGVDEAGDELRKWNTVQARIAFLRRIAGPGRDIATARAGGQTAMMRRDGTEAGRYTLANALRCLRRFRQWLWCSVHAWRKLASLHHARHCIGREPSGGRGKGIMNAADQDYMLDTTEFNHLLDGKISAASLSSRRLLVTGIQEGELCATRDCMRREALLAVYKKVDPIKKPASSFAFDIEGAGWGQAYWNDGSGNVERMLQRLQELDPKSKGALNQWRDILIAETAIKNDAILVSHDGNLRQVVLEFGGRSIDQLP